MTHDAHHRGTRRARAGDPGRRDRRPRGRRAAGRGARARRPAGDRGDAAHAGGAGRDRADRGRGAGRRRRRRHGHDARARSPTRSPPARASSSPRARRRRCSTRCRRAACRSCPGTATASDIVALLERGITHAKFFPAEVVGGVKALKAFAGPFPQMRFCPTGGIDAAKAPDYLALPNVVCVGGSWMTRATSSAAPSRGATVQSLLPKREQRRRRRASGDGVGADGCELLESCRRRARHSGLPARRARHRRMLVDRDDLARVGPAVRHGSWRGGPSPYKRPVAVPAVEPEVLVGASTTSRGLDGRPSTCRRSVSVKPRSAARRAAGRR